MARLLRVSTALVFMWIGTIASIILLSVLADERVVFTQLLHRHGARGPLPAANSSHWCPPAGCGLLNDEGKDMLVQLGRLIKQRYGANYFGGANGGEYVANQQAGTIYTYSTAVPRTLQSADGVLRGLFPNMTAYYPTLNNVPQEQDALLTADTYSAYALYSKYASKASGAFPAAMAAVVTSNFPDRSVIEALAAEAMFDGYCAEQQFNGVCIGKIQDLAASLNAVGTLPNYPLMSKYYTQLNNVKKVLHTLQWRYEPSTYPLDALRGTVQRVPETFISNMQAFVDGSQVTKFMHYSAHDGTTMPFSIAIGDADMMPLFGKMYLVDLVVDNGAYYVKGIQGAPEQTPGAHAYTTEPLKLSGMLSDGTVYTIGGSVTRILFEDFTRFVRSTKGTDSKGLCYVEDAVLKAEKCDVLNTPATGLCLSYRINCPQWACPANTYVRYDDYACVATDPSEL